MKSKKRDYTSVLLESSQSISETESLLNENKNKILSIAASVIEENGYDYPVTADITDTYFPTKTYGNYTDRKSVV